MRRIVIVLALLLGAFTLAACSSGGSSSSSGSHMSDSKSGTDMGSGVHGGGGKDANRPVVPGAPEIAVTGDALAFTPKEITLKAGQPVNIAFTAGDLEHDLYVKGVGHVAHANAGETTKAGLQIDEPGTYAFWCTVKGHKQGGMTGTITVTA